MALGLGAVAAGCQCRPALPSDDGDDDTEPPPFTGVTGVTGDTAPPPPCAVPEVEPNDSEADAVWLPLERRACGTIDAPFDIDWFEFEVEEPGWISIEVEADDGSIADMTFLLRTDDWAAQKEDDTETTDASITFPAPAGTYTLAASEELFNGGERYGYELLVSEAKPPVVCGRDEAEPNDSNLLAEVVTSGQCLFGSMVGNGALEDFDWYRIAVPAGKHTLTLDVDAWDVGSSADLTILLWNDRLENLPLGCNQCEFRGGQISGVDLDPFAVYDSAGDEIVWVQVFDARGEESPAGWYALHVTLEAG